MTAATSSPLGGLGLSGYPTPAALRTEPPLLRPMQTCARCEQPIQDKYLMNVLNRAWHQSCVTCADCDQQLEDKCYTRDGKIYCKQHFFRRYGQKCEGCGFGISPTDLVRRARDRAFHVACFTCCACGKQLATGEQLYVTDQQRFMCKEDFTRKLTESQGTSDVEDVVTGDDQTDVSRAEPALPDPEERADAALSPSYLTPSPGYKSKPLTPDNSLNSDLIKKEDDVMDSFDVDYRDDDDSPKSKDLSGQGANDLDANSSDGNLSGGEGKAENGSSGGGSGSKRRGPRTTIKAKQLETLKAAFAATPKPTRHIREQLAQETGLNMRVIQVWFQNRRSKERRMKQLNAMGHRRAAYFRNPRSRLRPLDGAEFAEQDVLGPQRFAYFPDGSAPRDFYPGFAGYSPEFGAFPPGQTPDGIPPGFGPPPGHMNALDSGLPTAGTGGMPGENGFLQDMGISPGVTAPPDGLTHLNDPTFGMGHRPLTSLPNNPHPNMFQQNDVPQEAWS